MRVLRSIVAPPTTLMSSCETKFTGCCRIRFEIVRDKLVWDKAILLQKLAHEFQRRTLVPSALNQHIKHFALGIHGAPKIDHAAGDFQVDFIQMPGRVWLGPAFAQVRRDHPESDLLVLRDNQPPAITDAERAEISALGAELPRLWNHPAASAETRKRILR